jgi:hypothetical protein
MWMQTEYISAKTIIGEFWIGGTYDVVAVQERLK